VSSGPAGLQPERTALAWDRTGVAFLVVGALLVRASGPPYPSPRIVPGLVSLLLGASLVVASARWRGPERMAARPRLVRLVGSAAVLVSVAALWLVLVRGA
jgi:putative membrane protein